MRNIIRQIVTDKINAQSLRSAVTGCVAAALLAVAAPLAAHAQAVIYTNAPYQTGATATNGTAAPAGSQFSEVQNTAGTGQSNTTLGVGCQLVGTTADNRCADDFTVPTGETWTLNQVIVYGYQTGSTGTTSPFIGANLQIWNGRPGDPGSTIIFGDTTTNRLANSTDTATFRIGNSRTGLDGGVTPAAPGTTRRIWRNALAVSPNLALTTGTYWIDFQLNAGANGNFSPAATIVGARTLPFHNGRQRITGATTWQDIADIGEPTVATPPQPNVVPDVILDFPFQLDGTRTGQRAITPSRAVDFNGDNKSDFAVTRGGLGGTTGQLTWYILNNGTAGQMNVPFGIGTDIPVAADYDGDGKTDIAVWRTGAANNAFFYIINSSTNTFRSERFGQTNDIPTVVGDYDGDGKADVAVFRNGATAGAQSFFYYRPSSVPGADFRGVQFGQNGDKPYGGDFDGDGKYDFAVVRNSNGAAAHYQLLSTTGFRTRFFGNFSDLFVNADFDGDYKTDLTALRPSGSTLQWFVNKSASNQTVQVDFGGLTDFSVPGDYDGDGRTDFAVWRPELGTFFLLNTNSAPTTTKWGQQGDFPVAYFRTF